MSAPSVLFAIPAYSSTLHVETMCSVERASALLNANGIQTDLLFCCGYSHIDYVRMWRSEDLAFCHRARSIGIPIAAYPPGARNVAHYGSFAYVASPIMLAPKVSA